MFLIYWDFPHTTVSKVYSECSQKRENYPVSGSFLSQSWDAVEEEICIISVQVMNLQ